MSKFNITFNSLLFPFLLFSQQLDIEGDSRIIGKMNMIHAIGDSSVFIGVNAGVNDDGQNYNTFVGKSAGNENTLRCI